MDILSLQYEEPLIVHIEGVAVKIVAFKTDDHKIVKFGVEAPRSVKVHREEIFLAIREKERLSASNKDKEELDS